MNKFIIYLCISFVLFSCLAKAEDFDDTYQAYRSGRYEQELKLVKSPAKSNVEKILNADDFDLYKRLAEQGVAIAQNNLGLMYKTGQGVSQDYDHAIYWLTKAAKQGSSEAQYNLGGMFYFGEGVARDYKQSAEWYKKAAEQGSYKAQSMLGYLYSAGYGVLQNFTLAYMWANLGSISGGDKELKLRDLIAVELPDYQLVEAQKLANECQKRNYKNCD